MSSETDRPERPTANGRSGGLADHPLAALKVIDRLEVGPVRLEPNRMLAPYRVFQQGKAEEFEFVYRYEEKVFEPDDPGAINLASMMAAQVALNYGLFCDEIYFRGSFDGPDRQFLEAMAKNTAREIFVKKFLQHNPFLIESVQHLPPVRQRSYLQARLRFESSGPSGKHAWHTDRSSIAVLSSGGKESLLSYSLLNEIGAKPHSLFVNESGKHWFTALNGYRYFASNCPGTARVWTNSDRLFPWMLRRLPFIRNDFGKLRSDEYPIRLWTVAVFLFGVLPIMRRRGIGRLVIGDEFDTTVRAVEQGIPHYDGLYDQCRHFDLAMTRYFRRKGWGVSQFSIVRPLSELLIEKILVERYPEIQRLQVSCHAAHIDGDRVYPCGQCEKCGRVVGMLVALGADPQGCGYTPEQIKRSLAHLASKGATQETPALEQLAYLLQQRNAITGRLGKADPEEHREIMQVRFDSRHSRMEEIPTDLRAPLFKIMLQHAQGSVRRQGRVWIEFDPLQSPEIRQPYPFESSPVPPSNGQPAQGKGSVLWAELSWPTARARLKETDTALLPVGALEQHGRHLPLDTDAFDAEYLCVKVAERCSTPQPLVLPLVPYGVSYAHDDFAGTVSIGPETLSRLIYDIGLSAARNGITKLLIINGHGGNVPSLSFAAQLIHRDAHIFTCVESGETSDSDINELIETDNDVHAGEIETSTELAVRPHLVNMGQAKPFVPKFSSQYLDFTTNRSVVWYGRTAKISPTGVLGDPTKATVEKGRQIWELMISHLVAFVEDLKVLTLDEIHQRSGL